MGSSRTIALGLSVAATTLVLAAAFITANSALYLLAGLAAVSTLLVWRRRGAP
ncbi:MAG: hypothetical protein ACXWU1_11790 [Allosphingosinicella sp.]